jgi:UDP-galactopyranose mutase
VSYDTRYFQDTYQAMPKEGYTALFRRMLAHPNIKVLLGADWREVEGEVRFDRLVFTGPIDEFFGYLHGPLPYRSLRFVLEHHPLPYVQEVGTVNYPNEHPYTRSTEFKHLTGQDYLPHTTLAYEYPEAYEPGRNEPYYPVPREENEERLKLYLKEGEKLKTVFFAGRLGDYRYYNMDQAVARALKLFEEVVRE